MADEPILMPQPVGLFAKELFERAKDYFDAFERLATSDGRELQFPMYFLLAHGVEVLLKAHLAARGQSKRELFGFGHKLETIYAACDNTIHSILHAGDLVARLAEMNRHHDFRYPSGYNLSVPPPDDCLEVVRNLRDAVAPAIQNSYLDATLSFASDTRHLQGQKIQWSD